MPVGTLGTRAASGAYSVPGLGDVLASSPDAWSQIKNLVAPTDPDDAARLADVAPGSGIPAGTGADSQAIGIGSDASGDGSIASGLGATASGFRSVASGFATVAYSPGQHAEAAGQNGSSAGLGQVSRVVLTNATTDATPAYLKDPAAGNFTMQTEAQAADYTKTARLSLLILARRVDVPGTASAWEGSGLLDGDGSSAYRWVGGSAPVPAVVVQDAAAAAWSVAVAVAGATVVVTVTGAVGATIEWMAELQLAEVV